MRETREATLNKETVHRHLPGIALGIFAAVAMAMILVGYLALQVPVVAVCTLVILEAVLCVCLNRIPVWVHGVIVALQIAMGFFLGKGTLMICMAVVYVLAVIFLYIWTKDAQEI